MPATCSMPAWPSGPVSAMEQPSVSDRAVSPSSAAIAVWAQAGSPVAATAWVARKRK